MTNICRCGTYQRIRAAIHLAAKTGKGVGSVIHMVSDAGEILPHPSNKPEEIAMTRHDRNGLSRRAFVVSSAAAGAGLSLGFHWPAAAQTAGATAPEINAWVVVQPDETCIIRVARAEMGQGTHTGLAQLVAEELDCDWSKVQVQMVSPGQNLARKRVWRDMSTGGSRGCAARRTTCAKAAQPLALCCCRLQPNSGAWRWTK